MLIAFPILAGALLSLEADRMLGAHVFDPSHGGPILWQHLFWFFGHPEVYIIALPFFGIISEILPVFSRKPIFGYVGLVGATLGIAILSVAVWAHHMFVTGAVDLPFFSGMTFLIAVPTGVKFFNWIGTMWGGSLSFDTPMLWSIGFLTTFLFGGLTGVILASPPLDFHVSDSYFVVAHFHYVVFGTVVFAMFAGFYFWWPKMTGRMLDERLGKIHFWLLSSASTPRSSSSTGWASRACRVATPTTSATDGFTTLNQISTVGAFLLAASTLPFLYNVYISPRRRWSRSTTRGAGAARSSGPPAARRRATTSTRCRGSARSRRPSTCTTRRSRCSSWRRTTAERDGELADAPEVDGREEMLRDRADDTVDGPRRRADEGRSVDLRDHRPVRRGGGPGLLVHHGGLDRHSALVMTASCSRDDHPLPRLPRLADGPAAGGPQGGRDRRRRRGAGLLPALLLVAAVVRPRARRGRLRRRGRLVAGHHRLHARGGRALRLRSSSTTGGEHAH